MKKYEIMYIVNASLDDAAFKTVSDRLHATITGNGGSIDKVDDWGVKEFAYEIDHMKGHYVVINVTANNAGVFKFQRLSRISKNVIRIMVVKKKKKK